PRINPQAIRQRHVDLPGNAAAQEHVESFPSTEGSPDADTFEADIGGEVLGATGGATAHVDANAVELDAALPQFLHQLKHLTLGFDHRNVAKLTAGAGHGVAFQWI